jgi:hypothetical protein
VIGSLISRGGHFLLKVGQYMHQVIIPCPYCSAKNRVPAGRLDVVCGKCKKPLYDLKTTKYAPAKRGVGGIFLGLIRRLVVIAIVIAVPYFLLSVDFDIPSPTDPIPTYTDAQKLIIKDAVMNVEKWDKQLIQSGLKAKGFYNGPIDGLIGPQTLQALYSAGEKFNYEPKDILIRVARWERTPTELFAGLYKALNIRTSEMWFVGRERRVAPFEVRTSPGQNYYVKLKDNRTGSDVLGLFIRGGESYKTKVPLGSYKLVYASGKDWYGEPDELYFGPNTGFSKADTVLEFATIGRRINGHTISLVQVKDGNLRTSGIDSQDF